MKKIQKSLILIVLIFVLVFCASGCTTQVKTRTVWDNMVKALVASNREDYNKCFVPSADQTSGLSADDLFGLRTTTESFLQGGMAIVDFDDQTPLTAQALGYTLVEGSQTLTCYVMEFSFKEELSSKTSFVVSFKALFVFSADFEKDGQKKQGNLPMMLTGFETETVELDNEGKNTMLVNKGTLVFQTYGNNLRIKSILK